MTRLLAILILICALPALAAEPYAFRSATLVSCTDGDTCTFNLHERHPVLGRITYQKRPVRLEGIDAPELHPARCPAEQKLGELAKARLLTLLKAARTTDVTVTNRDKYGRLVGHVVADGKDVSAVLLSEGVPAGWMRPYIGGRRRGWC